MIHFIAKLADLVRSPPHWDLPPQAHATPDWHGFFFVPRFFLYPKGPLMQMCLAGGGGSGTTIVLRLTLHQEHFLFKVYLDLDHAGNYLPSSRII